MEENFVYDDLDDQGDLGVQIDNLQRSNEELNEQVSSLKGDVERLNNRISEMQKIQDNLSKNISILYNTAKKEIERKDRRIAELQSQLDDLIFRKKGPNLGFKRKWEGSELEESTKRSRNDLDVSEPFSTTENSDNKDNMKRSNDDVIMTEEKSAESNNVKTYRESECLRRIQGGDSTYCRDKREYQTERKDVYQNDNRNRNLHKDDRDVRRDHKDYQGTNNSGCSYRDERRDDREMRYRDSHRDDRDRSRRHRDKSRGRIDDSRSSGRDKSRGRTNDSRSSGRDKSRGRTNDSRSSGRDKSRGRILDSRTSDRDKIRGKTDDVRNNHVEHRNQKIYDRKSSTEYRDRKNIDQSNDNNDNFKCKSENFENMTSCDQEQQREHIARNKAVVSTAKLSSEIKSHLENLNDSKEEGEVSDEEKKQQPVISDEKVSKKTMDFGKNLPFDSKKSFNVEKFIQKQQERNKRRNSVDTVRKNKPNDVQETGIKEERKENTSKTSNEKSGKEVKEESIVSKRVKEIGDIDRNVKPTNTSLTVDEMVMNEQNRIEEKNNRRDCNVNIISQVILHEVPNDVATAIIPKSQSQESGSRKCKETDKIDKPALIQPNVEKKRRESRVPRNLTDELNINLEKDKNRHEYITQLIGSSEKKSPLYALSENGEIPKLKLFSDPDATEIISNDETKDTNPVTEFQIFKTNLPVLEKSNSLTSISVQIQKPRMEAEETSQKESSPSEEKKNLRNNTKMEQSESEQLNSDLATTKGEVIEESSFMNLDVLNMDIKQCKIEDFPNLAAHSDSRLEPDFQMKPSENETNLIVKILPQNSEAEKSLDVTNLNKSIDEIKNEKKEDMLKKTQTSTPNGSDENIRHPSCEISILESEPEDYANFHLKSPYTYKLITPIKETTHAISNELKGVNLKKEVIQIDMNDDTVNRSKIRITKSSSPSKINILIPRQSPLNKTNSSECCKKEISEVPLVEVVQKSSRRKNVKELPSTKSNIEAVEEGGNYVTSEKPEVDPKKENCSKSSSTNLKKGSSEKTLKIIRSKSINCSKSSKNKIGSKESKQTGVSASSKNISLKKTSKKKSQSNVDDKTETLVQIDSSVCKDISKVLQKKSLNVIGSKIQTDVRTIDSNDKSDETKDSSESVKEPLDDLSAQDNKNQESQNDTNVNIENSDNNLSENIETSEIVQMNSNQKETVEGVSDTSTEMKPSNNLYKRRRRARVIQMM